MEEIGCSTDTGGTALLSLRYQVSRRTGSVPELARSSLSICSSEDRMYVGIGLYPYFCPRNTCGVVVTSQLDKNLLSVLKV
jgi:hypothetical protein